MIATPPSTLQEEARTLRRFLDHQRCAVLAIVEGLGEQAWHRPIVPSGWTPAGLLAHLGGAERHWFQDVVLGLDDVLPWDDGRPDYDPRAVGSPGTELEFAL